MQQDYLKQIGGRIRDLRKDADLTQEELADRSGINAAYVARIERGEVNVTIQTLVNIAQGLKVELYDVVRPARAFPDPVKLRKDAQRLLYRLDAPTLALVKELLEQQRKLPK